MQKRPKSEQTSGCYSHHWTGTTVQSFKLGVDRNKCLANRISHADWGTCSSSITDGYWDSMASTPVKKKKKRKENITPIKPCAIKTSSWHSCDSALTVLHFQQAFIEKLNMPLNVAFSYRQPRRPRRHFMAAYIISHIWMVGAECYKPSECEPLVGRIGVDLCSPLLT